MIRLIHDLTEQATNIRIYSNYFFFETNSLPMYYCKYSQWVNHWSKNYRIKISHTILLPLGGGARFWTSFVTHVGMSLQQKHPLTNHYLHKRLYKLFDKWLSCPLDVSNITLHLQNSRHPVWEELCSSICDYTR